MSTKAVRTRNMRYKRPALASLGFDVITNELYEISCTCSDVQWFVDDTHETLLNALDGDEEAEYEFRMAFSDLSYKADALDNAVRDYNVQEHFDNCIVGLIGNRYRTLGFDAEEEDYFSLTSYEQDLAYTESGKKLMRKTKAEMLSIVGQCLGVVIAFLDLRHSYDYLKATFDILKDENTSVLKIIKDIDSAYEAASDKEFYPWAKECEAFNALLNSLPDRTWLE